MTIATTYNAGVPGYTSKVCNGLGQMQSANIYGNTFHMAGWDANAKRAVFSHEIGHALGAAHTSVANRMMYGTMDNYFTYGIYYAQADDIAGINANY